MVEGLQQVKTNFFRQNLVSLVQFCYETVSTVSYVLKNTMGAGGPRVGGGLFERRCLNVGR
jgi:hypothetical protein